jgi:hypothetical protein
VPNRFILSFLALTLLAVGCATSVNTTLTGGVGGRSVSASTGSGGAGAVNAGTGGTGTGPIACNHGTDCKGLDDACNIGACLNNICVKSPSNEGGNCDDGLYCTVNDACMMGTCTGTPRLCSAAPDGGADPCQAGMCNEAMKSCIPMPGNDGAPCTPTDACFTAGECAGGACLGTTPKDCSFLSSECATGVCDSMGGCKAMPHSDGTACNTATADPCAPSTCVSGVCKPNPMPDGTMCDDMLFEPCQPGKCTSGICTPQMLPDNTPCDLGFTDPCNTGACMASFCSPVPANDGTPCDDGLFCTVNDMCKMGTCTGTPNPCTAGGGCYTGTCDTTLDMCMMTKVADGTACNDGDVCNTGKTCMSGLCSGGTPTNNGKACTPTMSCNVGTTCMSGMCTGGTGPTIYFQDEFNDNSKGWTLDTEWQIGPTKMSNCLGGTGNPDPAIDQPMTSANGVAGVVIGGCEDTSATHPFRYLTSPAFDTSTATGSVIFGYYRWLNSDYNPYMTNVVDVYDGTTWHNLWTTGGPPPVQDASWTYVSYDVTAYKNAKMQVRFGFNIGSVGVFTVSSWNVDDVLVANAKCP